MMPVLRLNDATFADLSTLKTWYGTKTPNDTIDRIVREALEQLGMERDEEPPASVATSSEGVMEFTKTPGLSFTKPLSASINGRAVPHPNWSSLLLTMVKQLKAKGFDSEKLADALHVPAKNGRYEEEGFKFHSTLGISIQGQSAADAWKEIDRISKKWSIPVEIEFWWRKNAKAQFPGKTGRIRSGLA